MKLVYERARKATVKGPYIYVIGGGHTVVLHLGEPKEVPDEVAHKILELDGDIIKVHGLTTLEDQEKPNKKKAASAPKTKDVKSYANKDLPEL